MAVVWLLVGVVLLAVELHHLAFYALFGAIAALAAAVVALVAPSAIPLQVGVFVAVTILGVVVLRPYVNKRFAHRREGQVARGVHGGLIGAEVLTLDTVGDEHAPGHVLLAGERWLAVSGSGDPLQERTAVVVTGVRGTTLLVWPLLGAAASMPPPGTPSPGEPPPSTTSAIQRDNPSAPDGAEGATS